MKKLLSFIISIAFILSMVVPVCADTIVYGSNTVTVYITVNTIQDIDTPLNTIYPRTAVTVSDFNVANFGSDFTGITMVPNCVTYLHALIQLHRNLYGDATVSSKLGIYNSSAYKFMGVESGSIMYKNGNYIFSSPNLTAIHNGDEINVCLYDAGYNQNISTFGESYISTGTDTDVPIDLYSHHWYPEEREPIQEAMLTNENGIFYLRNKQIVQTDESGNAVLRFSKTGKYKVTILPTLGYYMSQNGGTYVVIGTEEHYTENPSDNSGSKLYKTETTTTTASDYSGSMLSAVNALVGQSCTDTLTAMWANMIPDTVKQDNAYTQATPSTTGTIHKNVNTYHYTTTTKKWVAGEITEKVDYTTPWLIINVTDDLMISTAKKYGKSFEVTIANPAKMTGKMYCAGYINGALKEIHSKTAAIASMSFTFTNYDKIDEYKVYFWNDNIQAIGATYDYICADHALDYTYKEVAPTNTFITSR